MDADRGARAVSRRRLKANAADAPGDIPAKADGARARKLGERVAFAIKRDIAEAGWPVGKLLGNQVELMQRYKIGRSTLREAVRQIERHGIARMQRGTGGGLIVQQPAHDSVVLALASYLELVAVRLPELYEARELLEGQLVELASERATKPDLQRMLSANKRLQDSPGDDLPLELARHFELRAAIVALPRNPALALLIEALYRVTSDAQTNAADDPRLPALLRSARREKQQLVDALLSGDVIAGQQEVRKIIRRSRQMMESELKAHGHAFDSASALTVSAVADPDGTNGLLKLGHRVSLRIANDIAASGAERGAHIGAERDLCERYKVSRATLREALRTLEIHGLVQLKRGYCGGMVVGRADSAYTVELVSIYFQYARLRSRHFYEVWRAMQIACAQLAATRIDTAGRAELKELMAEQHKLGISEVSAAHGQMHLKISELSRNRVLALFTRIMSDIASYYPSESPSAEVWAVLIGNHANLVAAICAGDAPLARRHMARHMRLIDAWYGNIQRKAWARSLA